MPKFPVDAPKQRVTKSFDVLGFKMIREKEHISMTENRVSYYFYKELVRNRQITYCLSTTRREVIPPKVFALLKHSIC